MNWIRVGAVALVMMAGCKTVVTTTTEIRPNRYAGIEFARIASRDSIMAYAARALEQEQMKVLRVDAAAGTVMSGPVMYAAEGNQPALEATVTITTQATGDAVRIRIFASSMLEQNQVGGEDPRLVSLVQRVNKRLDTFIGH